MKRILLFVFLFSTIVFNSQAQTPPTAEIVLKEASKKAAKEKKKVFIIFHASWCGWCHKMDSSMNDKSVKKFFDDNFIIRHLVVSEAKDKKALENPGAEEMMKKYHGGNSGIPFWLIFDAQGKLLADSQIRPEGASINTEGNNVGCPASPEEVAHFIKVLKKTTTLGKEQLALIEARFSKNKS